MSNNSGGFRQGIAGLGDAWSTFKRGGSEVVEELHKDRTYSKGPKGYTPPSQSEAATSQSQGGSGMMAPTSTTRDPVNVPVKYGSPHPAFKDDKTEETPFNMNKFFQDLIAQPSGRTPTPGGGSGIQDVFGQMQGAMQENVDSRMQHANQLMGAMQKWFDQGQKEAAGHQSKADSHWRSFGRQGGSSRGAVRRAGASHRQATAAQGRAKEARSFWEGGAGDESELKKAAFDAMSGLITGATPSMISGTSSDWGSVLNAQAQGDRTDTMHRGDTLKAMTSLATGQMGQQGQPDPDAFIESFLKETGSSLGGILGLSGADDPEGTMEKLKEVFQQYEKARGSGAAVDPTEFLKAFQQ